MIQLTEKDADVIANICREELDNEKKAFENAKERVQRDLDKADGITKLLGLNKDEDVQRRYNTLKEGADKALKDMEVHYNEEVQKWQKIIELVTVGSEV